MQIKSRYNDHLIFDFNGSSKETIEEAVKQNIDLSGANLRNLELKFSNFKGGKFNNADFSGSDCKGTDWTEVSAVRTDFGSSCQSDTKWVRANASHASFWCSNFRYSNLEDAILTGIDIRACKLAHASLGEKWGAILMTHNPYMEVYPIGLYQESLQAFKTDKGLVIILGKFKGFVKEFEEMLEVVKSHGTNIEDYLSVLELVKRGTNELK